MLCLARAVVRRGGGGRVFDVVVGEIVVVEVVVVVDAELGMLSDSIACGSSRRGSPSGRKKVY